MFSEETLYSVALRHCPLIGDIIFRKLIGEAGSAKEVWNLSKSGLKNIFGIGKKISLEIGNADHLHFAEKELKFCEKNNIKINLRHQKDLPTLLNECEDAPAILYQKGNYNPFSRSYIMEGFDEQVRQMLIMMIAEVCREFEKLPIIKYTDILRNILYSGVWCRFEAVSGKRKKEQEKENV